MKNLIGEFLGTMVLTLFGCGVIANSNLTRSKGFGSDRFKITLGWTIAVIMSIFVARSTGSMQSDINPAISFAKFIVGGIYSFSTLIQIVISQILGAFIGSVLIWILYHTHFKETKDETLIKEIFVNTPAIAHYLNNFISEVIGTLVLVIGVGAIYGPATSGADLVVLGPILIGILILGISLSLGGTTGSIINPARDLGPRIAHTLLPIFSKGKSDWHYAWIPVAGPLCGGLLGAFIWKYCF